MASHAVRPALLSALAFPGLGQLANGHRWRALAFSGTTLALLVVLVRRVVAEASARLPVDDPDRLLDPGLPFRLAQEIQRQNASFFLWLSVALLVAWAASIVDAWFSAPADRAGGAARWTRERSLPRIRNPPAAAGAIPSSPRGRDAAGPGRRSSMPLPRFCSQCAAPLPSPPPVTCPSCDTSHWLDAKPCAGALVTRDGTLLLVRRAHEPWRGYWDVPGGFCGPREHPQAAAAREVREETGLRINVGEILGIWMDDYAPSGPDADKVTLNIYFHATVDGGADPTLDPNEVAEVAWFAPHSLPGQLAFPGHVPAVLRAWRASGAAHP